MNASEDRTRQQGGSGMSGTSQQQGGASQSGGTSQPGGGQAQQYSPGQSQQGAGVPQAGQGRPAVRARGEMGPPSIFRSSNPFEMLRRLDEDVDRIFRQFWGGGAGRGLARGRGDELQSVWAPQVEIFQREGKLHVHADLPGLKKDDVKLSIEEDQLVLQGERRSSHESQQPGGVYHSERSYGSFYRAIPLPEGVDPQTAQASFQDGVLDVSFDAPRSAQPQRRDIEIR